MTPYMIVFSVSATMSYFFDQFWMRFLHNNRWIWSKSKKTNS